MPSEPPEKKLIRLDTETPVDEDKRKHEMAKFRIDVNIDYVLMYIDNLAINEGRKDALRRMGRSIRDSVKEMP